MHVILSPSLPAVPGGWNIFGVLPRSALRWMRCVPHSGPGGKPGGGMGGHCAAASPLSRTTPLQPTQVSCSLESHISDLLRFPRCARSTPLPSLRCRQPFAARRTLHARVTPACAFPCPLRRSSRAAAPSRVAACAGPAVHVRPALRLSAPAARAHLCSRAGRGVRAAYVAAAALRTRASALPCRAAPCPRFMRWPAGAVC